MYRGGIIVKLMKLKLHSPFQGPGRALAMPYKYSEILQLIYETN